MSSTGEMIREEAPFGFGSDGVFGSLPAIFIVYPSSQKTTGLSGIPSKRGPWMNAKTLKFESGISFTLRRDVTRRMWRIIAVSCRLEAFGEVGNREKNERRTP